MLIGRTNVRTRAAPGKTRTDSRYTVSHKKPALAIQRRFLALPRSRSGASHYQGINTFFPALPASDNAAKSADDADESPAICARVAFGSTLLVPA